MRSWVGSRQLRLMPGLVLAFVLLLGCAAHSAYRPLLATPGSNNEACFGTTNTYSLTPVTGSLNLPPGAEQAVGGKIALPGSLPDYATKISSGLVTSGIGRGRQAFVVGFLGSSAQSPLGTILYADRAVCTLTPQSPDQTLHVNGHTVYVYTSPQGDSSSAVHGIFVLNGLYIDIDLLWSPNSVPSVQDRVNFLVDWVQRIVG